MTIGFGILLLLASGLAGLAGLALAGRLLGPEGTAAELVLGAFVGAAALVTAGVLCCGLVLCDMSLAVVAASVCLPAAALCLGLRSRTVLAARDVWQGLGGLVRDLDAWAWCLAGLFVLTAALVLAKIVLLPPLVWDSLAYHLPPAVEWFQQGRIPLTMASPVSRIDTMTHGMTLLGYWCFIFLGRDTLVELPQFCWGLALVPLAYAMLRRPGLDRRHALAFALMAWLMPACVEFSATTQDHLGLAVAFLAGAHFLFAASRTGRAGPLVLAAMSLGLCLGYKNTGPLFVMAAVVAVAVWGGRPWRAMVRRPGRAAALAFGLVLLALVLGGYWYAKNAWLFDDLRGGQGVTNTFAMPGSDGLSQGVSWFLANLADMPFRILDNRYLYDPDLQRISGWGPQFCVFGLFGLAAFVLRRPGQYRPGVRDRENEGLAWASLGLLLVYFWFYHSNNNYRHFFFFGVVFLLQGALALHRGGFLDGGRMVRGIMLACAVWALVTTSPVFLSRPWQLGAYLTGPARMRNAGAMSRYAGNSRDYSFLSNYVSPDEPVAYTGFYDKWLYVYADQTWRRRAVYVPRDMLEDLGGGLVAARPSLKAMLADKGVSLLHLVADDNYEHLELRADPDFQELRPGLYWYGRRP